jgi:hypothetical protein
MPHCKVLSQNISRGTEHFSHRYIFISTPDELNSSYSVGVVGLHI